FQWEVIGRGVSAARRGPTLSLAYGVGPLFAVAGSLGQDLIVNGVIFPWNFAALYALAAPIMALAAFLASRFVVLRPTFEAVREPFLQGVFGGMWNILRHPVLLTATIVTILIYTANNIPSNMNLYTKDVLGAQPAEYAGRQMALRFGFKVVAG